MKRPLSWNYHHIVCRQRKLLFATCGIKAEQYLRKMGGVILVASVIVWFWLLIHAPKPLMKENLLLMSKWNNKAIYLGNSCSLPPCGTIGFNWKVTTSFTFLGQQPKNWWWAHSVYYTPKAMLTKPYLCLKKISQPNPVTGVPDFTPLVALSFMVFVLLYFPCIASAIAVAKEAGSWKWGTFTVLYNTGVVSGLFHS